jgi:hypothetical protein
MKSLTQHINESMQIDEAKGPADKIVLQNLSWEEASDMIDKSGRDKTSLEYNIGYAEYYKALERKNGYGNGYNSNESDRYLEQAESILDDRAFKKNQTIRRKLKQQYVSEVFTKLGDRKVFVKRLSPMEDNIQKFEIFCQYQDGILFDILHDPSKSSNSLLVVCTKTIPSAKPLKAFQASTLKDAKSKIEKYIFNVINK